MVFGLFFGLVVVGVNAASPSFLYRFTSFETQLCVTPYRLATSVCVSFSTVIAVMMSRALFIAQFEQRGNAYVLRQGTPMSCNHTLSGPPKILLNHSCALRLRECLIGLRQIDDALDDSDYGWHACP